MFCDHKGIFFLQKSVQPIHEHGANTAHKFYFAEHQFSKCVSFKTPEATAFGGSSWIWVYENFTRIYICGCFLCNFFNKYFHDYDIFSCGASQACPQDSDINCTDRELKYYCKSDSFHLLLYIGTWRRIHTLWLVFAASVAFKDHPWTLSNMVIELDGSPRFTGASSISATLSR